MALNILGNWIAARKFTASYAYRNVESCHASVRMAKKVIGYLYQAFACYVGTVLILFAGNTFFDSSEGV